MNHICFFKSGEQLQRNLKKLHRRSNLDIEFGGLCGPSVSGGDCKQRLQKDETFQEKTWM